MNGWRKKPAAGRRGGSGVIWVPAGDPLQAAAKALDNL